MVFRVDDGTFAVVHLTWTTRQEPDPWPATQRISSYIALETLINDHSHRPLDKEHGDTPRLRASHY